jgi:hypothetical protein
VTLPPQNASVTVRDENLVVLDAAGGTRFVIPRGSPRAARETIAGLAELTGDGVNDLVVVIGRYLVLFDGVDLRALAVTLRPTAAPARATFGLSVDLDPRAEIFVVGDRVTEIYYPDGRLLATVPTAQLPNLLRQILGLA